MLAASRIVRRLRLRAPQEGSARRALHLLEDAMRTASLPDARGRIVVFRRLALGRIDPRAPPQTLALALERGVAQAQAEIVYGDRDARDAPAVWYRDALDAHTRLALRLAQGESVDAWYWPLVVRGWRTASSARAALRDIAFSLAALPEAPSALPRWTATLCEAGHARLLIEALRSEDVARLADAARVRVPKAAVVSRPPASAAVSLGTGPVRTAPPDVRMPPAIDDVLPQSIATRPVDLRRELVCALLRATGMAMMRARALVVNDACEDEPAASPAPVDAASDRAVDPVDRNGTSSGKPLRSQRASALTAGPTPSRSRPHVERSVVDALARPHVATTPREAGRRSERNDAWAFDGAPTAAGGLLFLVPVLARIGYPEWLDAHAEWAPFDLAQRVLAAALERVGVPGDDPAWSLAESRVTRRVAPRCFVAPALWREGLCTGGSATCTRDGEGRHTLCDASGRLLLGAWRGACPRTLVSLQRSAAHGVAAEPHADLIALATSAWLVASRRWLRRYARIGLADLILRPAAIASTPTHLDVSLDLARAGLSVRRAGLDLDPGWVSWLGRVVAFHYRRSQ